MRTLSISFLLLVCFSSGARADLWGADVAVLTQILANAMEQLIKLEKVVGATEDQLKLARQIYQGIHDAVALTETLHLSSDPGIYKDWGEISGALRKLEAIYGPVENSRDAQVHRDADASAAQAITLGNDLYQYAKRIDEIDAEVKASSRVVSPAGAAKMTVQALGVTLDVLNQLLRTQATGLKLQAQTLAIQNRKEKELTKGYLSNATTLEQDMKRKKRFFDLPRFEK